MLIRRYESGYSKLKKREYLSFFVES